MAQTRPDAGLVLDAAGWVAQARHLPSPNQDARPAGSLIELLLIHNISLPPGEFGSGDIERLFTNRLDHDAHPYFAEVAPVRVSSHLVLSRDGSVTQYVKFTDRAWHAGKSSFEGREACNDYSIGIELEGTDTLAYDGAQYHALSQVIAALCEAYPALSPDRVVGHSDIAPGRKTDPGPAFDWPHARGLIERACARLDRA